ncbi:MAG TPA: DUF1844 domain-containing protein [Conexibacter sp.]|jgi:hypothetical protein|nr:DUF1844 domain-containing protein [Conexibacter sp.]
MSTQDPFAGRQREPTEEEMRAALEEELKRVRVEQVVTEATVSILNVAVLRAGLVPGSESEQDLEQTRVGIEAVRALLPLVEQSLGAEQARPIRDALSQLQMAYVRAVEAPREPSADASDAPPAPERQPGEQPAEGPGPAQRSGRLWVPGQ